MIAYLNGKIKHKNVVPKKENWLVVNVGGVGYKVYVIDRLVSDLAVGDEVELFIYTQVAETALNLFGFTTSEELGFFELLNTISGIGPRSAMDILTKAKVDDLRKAVETGNHDMLSQVSGIGPKTAQKIVNGLKDKLGGLDPIAGAEWSTDYGDALEALTGLGYSTSQAREALSQSQAENSGDKVKEALRILGKK